MTDWEITIAGPRGGFKRREYPNECAARRAFNNARPKKGYLWRLFGPKALPTGDVIPGGEYIAGKTDK
jgi:hypothetical protein